MTTVEWEFKEDAEPQGSSDGFWYDITDGGYLDPNKALSDPQQVKLVEDAVALLQSFQAAMEKKELIIEF